MYRFMLWLVPAVEGFPRSQKFMLGDRIQSTALTVLEALIEATYTRSRERQLAQANLGLEKLRILFRLAKDLHHLDARRYEHAARAILARGFPGGGRHCVDIARRRGSERHSQPFKWSEIQVDFPPIVSKISQ